jgi:hypothetical protein
MDSGVSCAWSVEKFSSTISTKPLFWTMQGMLTEKRWYCLHEWLIEEMQGQQVNTASVRDQKQPAGQLMDTPSENRVDTG